ncbi:hypothetical protein J4427_01885 [Candidatus Woesearchaeota archaeon]|nr:hypothetical protein [Candidatus Woesearchaeota archaeon]
MYKHYSRKDVQEELLRVSKNREIQVWNKDVCGKRPDSVNYIGDISALLRQGMTSFHISVERWKDPLQLRSGMSKRELDELRLGFDLILDIDCKKWEYSRITAELLIDALKFHDVKDISLKFSGNHGFHIAVPFEAFPETLKGEKVNLLFPDIVRIIASYLKEMIKPFLSERLLKLDTIENLAKNIGKKKEELIKNDEFDPFSVVDIDTILISSRHMFRAPFSLNEKSGLVSIPIKDIKTFNLDDAKPENVKVNIKYLDLDNVEKGSAKNLLLQAYDWNIKKESYKIADKKTYEVTTKEIQEDFFPSCIKNILGGIKTDGRKRAVFILINFLTHMNWPIEKIDSYLLEWNKKNYEHLREGYIKAQISWYKKQNNKILPPNCDNPAYYKSMGINCGDCTKVRNPVNYATRMFNLKNFKNTKNHKKG